jgi:hypothetical protein
MVKFLNINVNDSNLGDRMAAPSLYFGGIERRSLFQRAEPCETLIVGGGGMFYADFMEGHVARWAALADRVIGWGIGSNTGISAMSYQGSSLLHSFGCRDYPAPEPAIWVPCVSCMSEYFDSIPVSDSMRTAIYLHKDNRGGIPYRDHAPVMANSAPFLEGVLRFLGNAYRTVTNSFHGAYWATLLGKPVIAYPSTSKFYGLRHSCRLLAENADWRGVSDLQVYPNALQECREANLSFAESLGLKPINLKL